MKLDRRMPDRVARKALNTARRRRQRMRIASHAGGPPGLAPVWPLPRSPRGPSDQELTEAFDRFDEWHYAYEFEGGATFSARHRRPTRLTDSRERPLQRFHHFMPWLLDAVGGTLRGKTVLDMACNSGFWSVQCALLGADRVTGFDARPQAIEEAELVKRAVGLDNLELRVLDVWNMTPAELGGTFDVVLNLGLLYHLPKPLQVLEMTRAMADSHVLLDTTNLRTRKQVTAVRWENNGDIRNAASSGVVEEPSKSSLELMFEHAGFANWSELPLRTTDMPDDYLTGRRASWLLTA